MISTGRIVMLFVGVLCALVSFVAKAPAAQTDYLSPSALVADSQGKTLYIAEETANQIAVFDVASGAVKKVISLPDRPSGLALAPDDRTLYVTIGTPNGRIHVVDLKTGKSVSKIRARHTPNAPVISPDGKTLYVCNRFSGNVAVYDVASKEIAATIKVAREPFAAAVTPDGKSLFVAHLIPRGASDRDYVAAEVSVIDTAAKKDHSIAQRKHGPSRRVHLARRQIRLRHTHPRPLPAPHHTTRKRLDEHQRAENAPPTENTFALRTRARIR